MSKPTSPIKQWMLAASVQEQEEMAKLAGTSRGTLYQYVSNRKTSSERAIAIETATKEMNKRTKGRLPVLYRTDLSSACGACHFARKCIGMKAEFPLLAD
jgi:DNA-binding transcriptional regulator YdaS (Cro superfamily)